MRQVALYQTGIALPSTARDNLYFTKFLETSDQWIRERTGIVTRFHCEQETCRSLAIAAAEAAVAKLGPEEREKIKLVIVATMSSDLAMPAIAPLLQAALGLPRDVLAYDLNAACSGFLYALETARHFLSAQAPGSLALIVGAEELSSLLDFQDRNTAVLFGDAAGATIWGLQDGGESSFSAYCETAPELLAAAKTGPLTMSGRAIFHFAVSTLCQQISDHLERLDLRASEIDLFLLHQANIRILQSLARRLGVDEAKFPHNLERYGNTSAASLPLLLHELREEGAFDGSKNLLLAGFGAGLTAGTLILKGHRPYVAQ